MSDMFPLITAHSGCEGFPDNSIDSVMAALHSGADVIEEDIRMTLDGVLVLAHDDRVETTEGLRSISSSNFSQLEGLVRLEEIVPHLKASGLMINIDLKRDECIETVAEFIRKHDLTNQAFVSGCESERAALAQLRAPELRKLLNAKISLFMQRDYNEAMQLTCAQALDNGCFGINVHYRIVTPQFLDYAASLCLPVLVWTVQEASDMRRMVEWGVHSITTRNISTLVKLKNGML